MAGVRTRPWPPADPRRFDEWRDAGGETVGVRRLAKTMRIVAPALAVVLVIASIGAVMLGATFVAPGVLTLLWAVPLTATLVLGRTEARMRASADAHPDGLVSVGRRMVLRAVRAAGGTVAEDARANGAFIVAAVDGAVRGVDASGAELFRLPADRILDVGVDLRPWGALTGGAPALVLRVGDGFEPPEVVFVVGADATSRRGPLLAVRFAERVRAELGLTARRSAAVKPTSLDPDTRRTTGPVYLPPRKRP